MGQVAGGAAFGGGLQRLARAADRRGADLGAQLVLEGGVEAARRRQRRPAARTRSQPLDPAVLGGGAPFPPPWVV